MPFDTGWYWNHTGILDTTGHGAYLHMLIAYWQLGCLPDDDRMLAQLTRLSLRRWKGLRPSLERMFEMPGWRHPYLDSLRVRSNQAYDRRVAYQKANDARRLPPHEWTLVRRRIFERDNYTCAYCGERGGNLQCDHIVPVTRGGSNEDENLTTSCAQCNMSKGALLISEWRQ